MGDRVVIVGAGLSGAVLARALADAGHAVTVTEARAHVAGNCHTARDPATGVLVHVYGPHVFHTDDAGVWDYVTGFDHFLPYHHRVRTRVQGRVYGLPVNLHTINQFFGLALRPDEARAFIAARSEGNPEAAGNFEEQALASVGRDLYEAFFKGYTEKQWGCAPRDLPAAIFQRLPLRFNYDAGYFSHRFQGMPQHGYTAMVARILGHPGIDLHLNRRFDPARAGDWEHVFWSGPLDGFFDYRLGRLGYRTLDFESFRHDGDWQGCAVMNYADPGVPWTRITEHKHFAPWEDHAGSVLYREYSRACRPDDTPYYPIRLLAEKALLRDYEALAQSQQNVTFVGRLGTYRYLDMDTTIRAALDTAAEWLAVRDGPQEAGRRASGSLS